jgi:hypothetical protein
MTHILALLLQLAFPVVPMPPVPVPPAIFVQAYADGPYANRDGWTCWKLDTSEATQTVHCDCVMRCDAFGNRMEDAWNGVTGCQTYCAPRDATKPHCRCHGDEQCEEPMVEQPK